MYVAVNVGNVHYRVCVLEIGVCGLNVRSVHYRLCVLEICVCGCKCRECALQCVSTGN